MTCLNQIYNLLQIIHNKVGIAMIDAGINENHPEMAKHIQNGSITLCKGFLMLNSMCLKNKYSHRTHRASVLLRLAPNTELLAARVFDDNDKIHYRN